MIVLDTNVVSELMRREVDRNVLAWVDRYPAEHVFLTAITAAELLYGIARLPEGDRKNVLASRARGLLEEDFAGRVLAFTPDAAVVYAEIVVSRERQGRPISVADAQIAAICRLHGADVATRNVKDFADTGIAVLDPWVSPVDGQTP
ncbi:type II toxin-antitoxin system VapC family toxin [Amycolatopsis taiwanensis]|uniref:type II toxin-antitoxin system VapC family toxin n=1 Tax=Amycolatopsis taiwanensis TaxID=342230 RepID=UPI00048A0557|nr:type II toxin-antitoxin system VapC family toxin [Amycolatopsis taiwanensis]